MKHRFLYIMALLLTVATGAWAQDPAPIALTYDATAGAWTYSQPEYDVELEVTYKTDLTLAVNLSGWTYGATANTPTVTGNTGNGAVTYNYKKKDADDETYSADVPTDAGTYTVRAAVAETDDYADGVATADFTIAAADIAATDITTPTANTLNFTGQAQALIEAGSVAGGIGTMQYSLDGTNWSTDIPTGSAEGDYTVYYKVVGDSNHNDVAAQSFKVTIGAALPIDLTSTDGKTWTLASMPYYDVELEVEYYPAATLTTAPTSIGEVYATGSAQALVTGGVAAGGSFEYALGTDATTVPTTGWTATVPEEAAPGTYFIWYKVVGDATHSDCETAPACLTATIKGIPVTIASGEYVTYYSNKALKLEDGSDMKLYTVVNVSGNTVTLSDPYDAMPENTPMLVYNPTANDATVLLLPCDDPGLTLTVYDGFKGTAEDKALNADGNGPWNFADNTKYYGMDGHDFVRIMTAGDVAAHRCWIEMSSASPARQLTIAFGEGTGVKGVKEVNEVKEVLGNSLYDLQGRKVQGKPARKGVYILNGKKKVIK